MRMETINKNLEFFILDGDAATEKMLAWSDNRLWAKYVDYTGKATKKQAKLSLLGAIPLQEFGFTWNEKPMTETICICKDMRVWPHVLDGMQMPWYWPFRWDGSQKRWEGEWQFYVNLQENKIFCPIEV